MRNRFQPGQRLHFPDQMQIPSERMGLFARENLFPQLTVYCFKQLQLQSKTKKYIFLFQRDHVFSPSYTYKVNFLFKINVFIIFCAMLKMSNRMLLTITIKYIIAPLHKCTCCIPQMSKI